MKPSGLAVFVTVNYAVVAVFAADATSPIDYTERNARFTPAGGISPRKQTPAIQETLQEKRVEKRAIEKSIAPIGNRQAAIEVTETHEKTVREKKSRRPEVVEQSMSDYTHRLAAVSTESGTRKPPTVAKYQDSLAAASATNMARFPAVDRATTAKINRFVFRKNPSESSAVASGSPVIPAPGGSTLRK